MLVFFPISQRCGKWDILWAFEKDMLLSVRGVWSAMVAVSSEARMETLSVFTRWGMSGDGASHAANGRNIVARHGNKERFCMFVTDVGFEYPLLPSYWEPTVSFVRLGHR